ncbi:hypothetical protein NQ315_005403 [Exocentrus adspersus]|uniref:Sperm microtubule inner protein 1 C-terminal domain-containing protein n=1 Tax=Exocentrus adspersus TaxID=1586481 RepID=A0AAV8W2J6_9CUCU|nr:hypothetical protein NQ315_005403 [Exocentrus adspersus]
MTSNQRGLDPRTQKAWVSAIEKENQLRLKWFTKNMDRLNRIANKENTRKVPQEVKDKFDNDLVESYKNVQRFPKIKVDDAPLIEPKAMQGIMKPVDPAVTKLIYTGENKDGRLNYLHERVKLLPDDRYYFPEVSSFEYGWKTWNYAKNIKKTGFGRQQIVKESFYRRRGVERDPEWYKEPAGYTPTVCNG